DRRGVDYGSARALPARHEKRVDRAAQIAQRALCHELEPGGHAHGSRARGDELQLIARVAALALREQASRDREHLERTGHVEDLRVREREHHDPPGAARRDPRAAGAARGGAAGARGAARHGWEPRRRRSWPQRHCPHFFRQLQPRVGGAEEPAMRTPDDLRSPARRSSLACGSLRETCARCAKPALAAALLAVLALAGCLLPNGGTPVLVDSRAGSFWSGKGLLLEVSPDQKRCKV